MWRSGTVARTGGFYASGVDEAKKDLQKKLE